MENRELAELATMAPENIDDALVAMRKALEYFHRTNDKRAIFLRLYYKMTLEVHAAVNGYGDYAGKQIFLDAQWIYRLSGKFSTLFFHSLTTADRPGERAWKEAYNVADQPHSTVVECALLGINAHINYDLPRAVAKNLCPEDLHDFATMQRRKFDHDQVNNLLVRTLDPIQDTLARDYEPAIFLADRMLGSLDEDLSKVALKHYRERVWWDGLAFAAAMLKHDESVVLDKLDWESYQLAKQLQEPKMLWRAERLLNRIVSPFRNARWSDIQLEMPGSVDVAEGTVVDITPQPVPAGQAS